jgi:hypothetical protein
VLPLRFEVTVKTPLPEWFMRTPAVAGMFADGPEILADWPSPNDAVVTTGLFAEPSNPFAFVKVTFPPPTKEKDPPATMPVPLALLSACTAIAVLITGVNPFENATSSGPGTTLSNHVRGDSNAVDAIARMLAIIQSSPLSY